LIGDDEHGWSDHGIFNFEGGCYAKTIDLSEEKEPQIYKAICKGALLENIGDFHADGSPDYHSQKITENTRVSYPLEYINRAVIPSIGTHPDHIFFLTCDAFGVLPPLAKLTIPQALYYFISGYTAKVAGTETGITEPTTTFSACFGRAFLPLHPAKYADLLGKKLNENPKTEVWLVNTGWSGGAYGVGQRMSLAYTRSLIAAVLNHSLDTVSFENLAIFNLQIPTVCPNVPTDILNPKNTWKDKTAYDKKAKELATAFVKNFEQYRSGATEDIMNAAPDVK
jgi:phosphoenolpyruvate carboxykinase (ATP)